MWPLVMTDTWMWNNAGLRSHETLASLEAEERPERREGEFRGKATNINKEFGKNRQF